MSVCCGQQSGKMENSSANDCSKYPSCYQRPKVHHSLSTTLNLVYDVSHCILYVSMYSIMLPFFSALPSFILIPFILLLLLLLNTLHSLTGSDVIVSSGVLLLYISAALSVWSLIMYMSKIWRILLQ